MFHRKKMMLGLGAYFCLMVVIGAMPELKGPVPVPEHEHEHERERERDGVDVLVPGPQDKQKPRPPKLLKKGQDCTSAKCHGPLTQGRYVHGPVNIKMCSICHVQPDPTKHSFELDSKSGRICSSCHELVMLKIKHKPVAEGNCTACHDPHHSANKFLLKTKTNKELCKKCHEMAKDFGKKSVHGPFATGACILCHAAHSSVYEALLKKKGTDICLSCHKDLGAALKDQKLHRPVSEDCSKCHSAHSSDHKFQLKAESRALCMNCHHDKEAEIKAATVFHEAMTTEEGCKNCHNTHASKYPKLLRAPVIELCLNCHDKPRLRKDGKVIKAIAKEIRTSKFRHGPIREGECSGCHNPHGSKNFRILRGEYPEKFYAPFDLKTYNLCFKCHESKVFTMRETETLTDFRNGDQNLHFLHVNKTTKGRTCRACHKTHASNLPKHMAEVVPFNGWPLPIDFKVLPTGGSCEPGCHKPKEYNRIKAIDYNQEITNADSRKDGDETGR